MFFYVLELLCLCFFCLFSCAFFQMTQAAQQPAAKEDQVRAAVSRAHPRGEVLPQGNLSLARANSSSAVVP